MPSALKGLDDRVLGDRLKSDSTPDRAPGDGAPREQASGEVYPDEPRTRVVERQQTADRPPRGDGAREALGVFARISRLVLLALAAVLVVGILFVLAPTNGDNAIVRFVFDVSEAVAGPFRDVFTVSGDADRELVVNYGFAALVYLLASVLVTKVPGAKT